MTAPTMADRRAGKTRRRIFPHFAKNRSGATTIEFAMLAIPFSLLVFAILESCISFAGQQVLANVTDDVARQIRTGQLRAATLSQTTLKTRICKDLEIIVAKGCPGLVVDLRQYTSFADAAKIKVQYTGDRDLDTTGFDVKPGPSMSKNMLRVFYKWPVMTDMMSKLVSNMKDGKTLHFASVTWQNEPFDD